MSPKSQNSIASDLERLALGGNKTMTPVTRSMARNAQVQRQAASLATGSGTNPVLRKGNIKDSQSKSYNSHPGKLPAAQHDRGGDQGDGSDDDDDDDDDEESGDEEDSGRSSLFWEIWALNEPAGLTPYELTHRNRPQSRYASSTLKYMWLGMVCQRIEQDPSVARELELRYTRDYRADAFTAKMRERFQRIVTQWRTNLQSPSQGHDVVETMESLAEMFEGIHKLIPAFPSRASDLTAILLESLKLIIEYDRNFTQAATRPQYVDADEQRSLYRRFLSANGGSQRLLSVLLQLDPRLLRLHVNDLAERSRSFNERIPELRLTEQSEELMRVRTISRVLQNLYIRARDA